MKNKTSIISIGCMAILIVIASFFLIDNKDLGKFLLKNEAINYFDNNKVQVKGGGYAKVYLSKEDKVVQIPVEEYIVGVVCAEMPANFGEEALKAQAVAARTFYYSKRQDNCKESHGGEICDTTHCQVYINEEEALSKWSEKDRKDNYEKIKNAVKSTENQVLTYDNKILEYPEFFATSSGKTEDSVDVFNDNVPYLKSIDSPGEESAPKYSSSKEIKVSDFISTINKSYRNSGLTEGGIKNQIKKLSDTEGGSVKEIKVGNITLDGTAFRKLFDLNSANFTIEFEKNKVKIVCKGYGHGVGMSQWGAKAMAEEGKNYTDILKHYYTGVEVVKLN